MGLISLIFLAVGLAMDAFAVSICKGLAMKKLSIKNAAIIGLWFGGFQALMPAIGYFLGSTFEDKITAIDHWVGFVLLALIGVNMIRESLGKDEDEETTGTVGIKEMFVLAVATSIDALAVGITFAFVEMNVPLAIILIGVITFAISMLGVKIGNLFGTKYKSKAEFAGGVILIFLGVKILLEGLGIIG